MSESSSDDSKSATSEQELQPTERNFFGGGGGVPVGESSDSDEGSSESSYDDGLGEAGGAQNILEDYGEKNNEGEAGILPSPADVFSEIEGIPDFLDPEATRPLAVNPHHGAAVRPAGVEKTNPAPAKKRKKPGENFDISSLAPTIGPSKSEAAKRGLPAGAVISAEAKRYKVQEDAQGPQYTEQQIALMGGGADVVPKKGGSSMEVAQFMDKGGSAALPRKNTDRRDREKQKRTKGQSSIGSWKTEAEMVLRQQFD
ncbi:hypothetical protein BSKO_03771 [Bryopsis sp. KO-2023]|nr:hypothetical protein BSKO_03771 [Bryopsis sp. KO-2023]